MCFLSLRDRLTLSAIGCALCAGSVSGAAPMPPPVAPPASQASPVVHLDPELAAILAKARSAALRVSFNYRQADALQAVARVYARAGDVTTAKALLVEGRSAISFDHWADLRAGGLVDLANEQLELKDAGGAKQTLADALQAADDLRFSSRAQLLATVAAAQARAGDSAFKSTFDAARAAAARDTGVDRAQDYQQIALELARCGDIAGARAMVERMDDSYRSITRAQIAEIQAAAGDYAGARATVAVKGVSQRDLEQGLLPIALGQARAGDIAAARATAGEIHDKYDAMNAQVAIIAAQARAGDIPGALGAAHHLAADPWSELEAYADISLAQADRHDLAGARATATRARDVAATIDPKQDGPIGWTWAWRIIATAQARAGDDAGARISFTHSRAAANKGDEQDTFGGADKHDALSALAAALADAGLFDDAKSAADALPEYGMDRPNCYRIIAAAMVRSGDLAGTLRWIDTVIPDAQPLALAGAAEGLLDRKARAGR